ncbi:MAG: RNA polymerase sporulation sigma factor SigH [Desulfitobacteriaceae bacterium]|nr:RNA polymerase sporulation sigma factor SigH [Desulfitobacteriaceae bacterium]
MEAYTKGLDLGSRDESEIHLVLSAQNGDMDAQEQLLEKYRGLVRSKAVPYFIIGAEQDDLIQEGLIGLFKAIRDFDSSHGTSFRSFATLCISRQIITAIKTATRQKHVPLNSYVSLNKPTHEDSDRTLMDVLDNHTSSPEDLLIDREKLADFYDAIQNKLSDLEREALILQLSGKSFCEIAAILSTHEKSIDNALWRAKRKLRQHFGTIRLTSVSVC